MNIFDKIVTGKPVMTRIEFYFTLFLTGLSIYILDKLSNEEKTMPLYALLVITYYFVMVLLKESAERLLFAIIKNKEEVS